MSGPEVPFPLAATFKTGEALGFQKRLGKGKYKAFRLGQYVKIQASGIQMSGIHPRAELVYVPTFVAPLEFELAVFETMPNLANLIIGTAETQYVARSGSDKAVVIVDSDGRHNVTVEEP